MKLNELCILDETNHYLVVVKPQNCLTQKDCTNDLDMMTMIKNYLKLKYQKQGNVFLGLIHRLDRMTSGIMVFGKTSKGSSRLCEQIRNHQVEKKYLAIVEGHLPLQGEIISKMLFDEKKRQAFLNDDGKEAILSYRLLKVDPLESLPFPHSLVEIVLMTGRHHQIRLQMSSIGHPLVGDSLYHSKTTRNIYLHAYYLSFHDPITKEFKEYINYPKWMKGDFINE